jgi:hypothetical protein
MFHVCPPPGIGAKIQGKFTGKSFGMSYFWSSVALEGAIINLEFTIIHRNGSAL